jgi:hypothetical protein
MERNLFGDGYGYEGCKLFDVPPLPCPPTPIKAYKVYLVGSRAEIIGKDLAKGQCAKCNGEKTIKKKAA